MAEGTPTDPVDRVDRRETVDTLDIGELEALSGVTRRTIRYYVQRGLVPPPSATGRGKHYSQHHLDRLIAVRTRQEAGESLESIAGAEPEATPRAAMPGAPVALPEAWLRVALGPGLELHAQAGLVDTVTLRRVAQLVREAMRTDGPQAPVPAGASQAPVPAGADQAPVPGGASQAPVPAANTPPPSPAGTTQAPLPRGVVDEP